MSKLLGVEVAEKKSVANEERYGHATPFPTKGAKRLRRDAARRGEHLISKSAWLRQKRRAVKEKD